MRVDEDRELLQEVEEELEREIAMSDSSPPSVSAQESITISFKQIATVVGFLVMIIGSLWTATSYLLVTKQEFSAAVQMLALLDKDVQQNTRDNASTKKLVIVFVGKQGDLEKDVIRIMTQLKLEKELRVERTTSAPADVREFTGARAPSDYSAPKSRLPEVLLMQVKHSRVTELADEEGRN